ncbi:asparagine synthase-related protein [Psychroserpens algicola]|uniref:asparagine synthase (glutamine-hydrolyzing) n=1 Tax=Psychroserpens algicola TaxID=1719034 RepID=A0ABT0H599_9FLAO|nr:asparagine synthase-related protein [Psychroserpens algicola]MCK8479563.1 asparagine synthase-related protein [Psychroserpens algicola]
MKHIRTQILPSKQRFAKIKAPNELNLKAIAIYVATGFFLDSDTFYKDEVCLLPAHDHTLDEEGYLIESKPWFEWYYEPRQLSFDDAVNEYVTLLKTITKEQFGDSKVILPLSGGLDSRSQALIFKELNNDVQAYSYSFKGGFPEHKISEKVAKACGFKFQKFEIPKGYLWDDIEELAQINGCYSEFTHPRQMAILEDLKAMEGEMSLGHWGDVLFDRGVPEGTQESDIIPLLYKKMVKKDGLALAKSLWETWGLDGEFESYLSQRLEQLLSNIKIDNVSAKVRAFKTSQWAHRWTSTNLSIFEEAHNIHLPYYDNRMCEFICTIPEAYLADRRMQLAHLKTNDALSEITWQDQKPFSIKNYRYNKMPYNLPYRVIDKLKREFNGIIGNPYIQRNFELQFLGDANDQKLRSYLFSKPYLEFIPESIVQSFYDKFKNEDVVRYSHSVSMLLTLSLWHKLFYKTN